MFEENLWLFVHQYIARNTNRKFVVFGSGSGSMKTVAILGKFAENISYFADNRPKSSTFYGKDVKNAAVLKSEIIKPFLFVASEYYKEIFEQLIDYGYKLNEDFICSIKLIEDTNDYEASNFINGVRIGKFSYGYEKHCFKGTALKEVGSFCSINDSAKIGESNHPHHLITTHPILYQKKDITVGKERIKGLEIEQEKLFDIEGWKKDSAIVIGHDVWVGANAVILPGVTIGDGSVIGAGAVVTKDVEPYSIVGGIPAKLIKYRFAPHEIEILLKIKWWDWPIEKIKENINLFIKPEKFFGRLEYEVGKEYD